MSRPRYDTRSVGPWAGASTAPIHEEGTMPEKKIQKRETRKPKKAAAPKAASTAKS